MFYKKFILKAFSRPWFVGVHFSVAVAKQRRYDVLFVKMSPVAFKCRLCGKTVSNKWHHAHSHWSATVACPYCPHVYTRKDNLKYHIKAKHSIGSHLIPYLQTMSEQYKQQIQF